jgi:hypothetical protein
MLQVWVCNNGIQEMDKPLPNSGWTCHAVGSYKYDPGLVILLFLLDSICGILKKYFAGENGRNVKNFITFSPKYFNCLFYVSSLFTLI